MLSTFTYGPAKAAPASRKGDAATAAIVDLIDMCLFKCLARILKDPADDKTPDMGFFITSTQGTIISGLSYVKLFIHYAIL